jgi:hypothetical protein
MGRSRSVTVDLNAPSNCPGFHAITVATDGSIALGDAVDHRDLDAVRAPRGLSPCWLAASPR